MWKGVSVTNGWGLRIHPVKAFTGWMAACHVAPESCGNTNAFYRLLPLLASGTPAGQARGIAVVNGMAHIRSTRRSLPRRQGAIFAALMSTGAAEEGKWSAIS